VLLFSKTAGFHHDSIPDAIAAIQQLGADHGFQVDSTEDSGAFTDSNLSQYQAVVFLLTTGTVLNADQEGVFQRFIEAGNGYVGVHSAADTEYDWPWYGQLMGAYFKDHPAIQPAEVDIIDHHHPSTKNLPDIWQRTDEWYNYQTNPKDNGVTVLANLDESTYSGGEMGEDHPITWYHAFDGGRAWYTGMGHTSESYSEPLFVQSLLGGIRYATGDDVRPSFPAPPGPTRSLALSRAVKALPGSDAVGAPSAGGALSAPYTSPHESHAGVGLTPFGLDHPVLPGANHDPVHFDSSRMVFWDHGAGSADQAGLYKPG
jgi:type 1 glutamine amidotransferase